MIEGRELVDKSELSKVKSVHEMMPRSIDENQRLK
jgi:hypothetical protein